jgi:hypothetical protein
MPDYAIYVLEVKDGKRLSAVASVLPANVRYLVDGRKDSENAQRQRWVGFCRSLPFGKIRSTVKLCCSAIGKNRPGPVIRGKVPE